MQPPADETPSQAYARALDQVDFGKQNLGLLLHARRLGKLLAIQETIPEAEFPPGVCFIHVNLPSTNSLCVRAIVEIDLDSCTLLLAIHGDQELEPGHVMIPFEGIGWFGFPDTQVQVGKPFAGFNLPPMPAAANKVVRPTGKHTKPKHDE